MEKAPGSSKRKLEVRKDVIRLEREPVIMTMKPKLVFGLANNLEQESDRDDFLLLCKRIEAVVRAWYHIQFEDMMQLYSLFDPENNGKKLQKQNPPPDTVHELEHRFLKIFFHVMEKSNFKLLTDDEFEVATSAQYLLNLPISVDKSRLDTELLSNYFENNPSDHVPKFANQYVIFRRGIGIDQTTGTFISTKLDVLIARLWSWIVGLLRLHRLFKRESGQPKTQPDAETLVAFDDSEMYVERVRIQNMNFRLGNFFNKITLREPTFERIIVLYRRAPPRHQLNALGERGIYIKQFKHIPMADMELVLPEKKNPSLTAMDWVKFLLSAVIGFVAFTRTMETRPDFRVALAILGGFLSYCAKIYFTFQANLMEYQRLITNSVYDKQLDSGKGTLLHLCDDVIQQEVKEVIIAYYVLMTQGKQTIKGLDDLCEELLLEEFGEKCNFEVDDAIKKLEQLRIVTKDSLGRYVPQSLRRANDIIGVTTDEVVAKVASS